MPNKFSVKNTQQAVCELRTWASYQDGVNRSRDAETRAGWKTSACSLTGEGAEPPGKEPHGAIGAVLRSLGISTLKLAFLSGLQRKTG